MKILKEILQSAHVACLAWSARGGVAAGAPVGWVFWRRNDKTAERVDDGSALRAISLFSTRAITSLPGSLECLGSQVLGGRCLGQVSHGGVRFM